MSMTMSILKYYMIIKKAISPPPKPPPTPSNPQKVGSITVPLSPQKGNNWFLCFETVTNWDHAVNPKP
ncbi:MAG: hypothetical protein ACI8ZM_004561 [Crocinitomix sp.]|jgi:hypothetical protein